MKVKVIPITKNMKNLVNQHGKIWVRPELRITPSLFTDKHFIIETSVMVHCGGTEPYACWITLGIDCDLEVV